MEISVSKRLIGGKETPSYERRYKELKLNDLMVFYVSKDKKIKGYCSIDSSYYNDKTMVWPEISGEKYPHRIRIRIIRVFDKNKESNIEDFYDRLEILENARSEKRNLGVTFGALIHRTTPIEISGADYSLLTGTTPVAISLKTSERKNLKGKGKVEKDPTKN